MRVDVVPCSVADKEFAFRVTEEAMRVHVEATFGRWDPDMTRRRLDESFDPATHNVIMVDGERAGILAVEERALELFLGKIFLLPAFQRRGIGTVLVRRLIERADAERKPLALRVLSGNTAAQRFYARLGFQRADATPEHLYFSYRPSGHPDRDGS